MRTVKGDLLKMAKNGDFDIIIHGCNCFHTMGGGIAAQIVKQFPEAYEADKTSEYGDPSKLGEYTLACYERDDDSQLLIVNAYTQFDFGNEERKVSYDAVAEVFDKLEGIVGMWQQLASTNINTMPRVAYPMIGAGLAGGDWEIIKVIIDRALEGLDHTLVEFQP